MDCDLQVHQRMLPHILPMSRRSHSGMVGSPEAVVQLQFNARSNIPFAKYSMIIGLNH